MKRPRSSINAPGLKEANEWMEQVILESEKFKATVEKPPSMSFHIPITDTNLLMQAHNEQMYNSLNTAEQQQRLLNQTLGNCNQDVSNQSLIPHQIIISGVMDDDFFHLTCHIDNALKNKIENGEYMDLDKLLPKDNGFYGKAVAVSNETKLGWVLSEGSTYLVLAKNTSRINCFRHWEQAFRMYATVYCTKKPTRTREIWQYVSVINTASMSYS